VHNTVEYGCGCSSCSRAGAAGGRKGWLPRCACVRLCVRVCACVGVCVYARVSVHEYVYACVEGRHVAVLLEAILKNTHTHTYTHQCRGLGFKHLCRGFKFEFHVVAAHVSWPFCGHMSGFRLSYK